MPRCTRRAPRRDERGVSIVEVMAALAVFTLVAVGLATSTRSSLGLVGNSNARQVATQQASAWMENSRGTPYDALGMTDGETYTTSDPYSPDVAVNPSATPPTFDPGTGAESLVVLAAGQAGVVHHETEVVNNVGYDRYRYVTWVADGLNTTAYKRVTVVVQWPGRDANGIANRITTSTLVAQQGVGWTGATTSSSTSTTAPGSTTTSSSTTSTTTNPACPGSDITGPSGGITILASTGASAGYSNNSTVNLSLAASDTCTPITMAFSNDGTSYSAPDPFSSSRVWTLVSGEGSRTVWVRYYDGRSNGATYSATVIVDKTAPATPANFTLTRQTSPRRAILRWTKVSGDTSLAGYRVYKQLGTGAFQDQPLTSDPCGTVPCQWTDNSVQNKKTYSYKVTAYDAAGNESAPTPTLTVTF